jgi:hypothetical protein
VGVIPRRDPSSDLLALAAAQSGVLTLEQAEGLGLSRWSVSRILAQGQWTRLARGVLWTRPLGVGEEIPWLVQAWGGVLAAGDGSRLGPRSSGYLHGLIDEAPRMPDVFARGRSVSARTEGPWLLRREQVGVRSAKTVGNPPRLGVEATVVDLCDGVTASQLPGLLTRAVQRRLTTGERIVDELALRARHRHRALIRDILSEVADGAESPLELAYLRDVERAHGLPRGRRQKSRVGLAHVSDVGYDDWALLLELDGRDGHVEEGAFRDRRRDNAFAVRALLTLRYGWYDVTDNPCAVAWQVATVLRSRGWPGEFRRCGRCRTLAETDFRAMG